MVTPVPFDHPLWVLFTSGTTGRPKGIVHGHGGVVLEHLKAAVLHADLGPGDVFFWQTALSWMMWNFRLAGLLCGATVVCYSGHPIYPDADRLWQLLDDERVTYFGTSPGHLLACRKAGLHPGAEHDLSRLRTLGSTGSPLPADLFEWVTAEVGAACRGVVDQRRNRRGDGLRRWHRRRRGSSGRADDPLSGCGPAQLVAGPRSR